MPDSTRLQDLRGRTLTVTCPCGRGGTYETAHLCRKLGPEMALTQALLVISQPCRFQRRVGSAPRNEYGTPCRARLQLEPVDQKASEAPEGFSRASGAIFRIDRWGPGGSITRELAFVSDLGLARDAFEAAVRRWPDDALTLRQRSHGIMRSPAQEALDAAETARMRQEQEAKPVEPPYTWPGARRRVFK